MTKKKVIANQYILYVVNLKLSWISRYFVDLIGNLYTTGAERINIFKHIEHIGGFNMCVI